MNTKHNASMPRITYTHDWIWSTPFLDWLSSPDSIFWICGKPGSGKSTLMAYLLHNKRTLEELRNRGTDFKIMNFFYDYNAGDGIANNVHGMLRMLLYQMAEQNQQTRDRLQTLLDDESIDIELKRSLLDACCEALNLRGSSYCLFIDGLDEYKGNMIELVQTCRQLTERTGVKLCLASRPEARVSEVFPRCPQLLMQDNNRDSMRGYVKERLLQIEESDFNIGARFPDSLPDLLIDKAEGILLWFKLTFEEIVKLIKQQVSDEVILRQVEQLPRGMDSLYERILTTIPAQQRSGAALMLLLVAELAALPKPAREPSWNRYYYTDRIPATNLEHIFGAFKVIYVATGHQFQFRRYSGFLKWIKQTLRGLVENRDEDFDLIIASNRQRKVQDKGFRSTRRSYRSATPGQFHYVHKTFDAYLRKSSWVEANLDPAIKLRYPHPFMLNFTADVIHTATTLKLFDPNQVTECLHEHALKEGYWRDVSKPSFREYERALVEAPCPIFDEVCPTSGELYRYDPIVFLTGSLKRERKNYMTCQAPLTIPVTWEDRHAILGTSFAVFTSLIQKSGWTPRLDSIVGRVLRSDLSIMFQPGLLGYVDPRYSKDLIRPARRNSGLRAVYDLVIAVLSDYLAYFEDRVMVSSFSDEQRELIIRAILLRACQRAAKFPMENYLRILLMDSIPITQQHLCYYFDNSWAHDVARGLLILKQFINIAEYPVAQSCHQHTCSHSRQSGNLLFHWAKLRTGLESKDPYRIYADILASLLSLGYDLDSDCYKDGTVLRAMTERSDRLDPGIYKLEKFCALMNAGMNPTEHHIRTALNEAAPKTGIWMLRRLKNSRSPSYTKTRDDQGLDRIAECLRFRLKEGRWPNDTESSEWHPKFKDHPLVALLDEEREPGFFGKG